jgi:aryl-phospho-beta-D-glucosidase BglC (GH1 family)
MLTPDFAKHFAAEWVEAWNSHDLERILSHYTADFEMNSPLIVDLVNEPSGRLRGKGAIREYWTKGLAAQPPIRFELLDMFLGAHSLALRYQSVGRRVVTEVFFFNEHNQVWKAAAFYKLPVDAAARL